MADPSETLDDLDRQVRRLDRDRWLTMLFAAPEDRQALAALYAFNQEVAKTRERVSEPMLGEIRLQWWRETIEGLYTGTVRRHPVAEALAEAVGPRGLPQAEFQAVIDARSADLYDDSPKSFDELTAYADASGGTLLRLAARICGAENEEALTAGERIGRAWALTGLLRGLAFQAAVSRNMLPRAELEAAGLAPETLYQGDFPEEAKPLARRMAETAQTAITEARIARDWVNRRALSPMLLARLAEDYLARFKRAGNDPTRAAFERGAATRRLKLFWAATRGRF